MVRASLLALLLISFMLGCAKQPEPTLPAAPRTLHVAPTETIHTTRSMITGLDQFTEEDVMVIQTVDDAYVIGPGVSPSQKETVYSHLSEAHDLIITIHYVEKTATDKSLAHKRVVTLVIDDTIYHLPH